MFGGFFGFKRFFFAVFRFSRKFQAVFRFLIDHTHQAILRVTSSFDHTKQNCYIKQINTDLLKSDLHSMNLSLLL